MSNNPHNVKVGQIWGDCDPRMGGREFKVYEIGETHATVVITRPNDHAYDPRPVQRIKLTRFKPTSTGYRLIEDVK